MLIPADARPVCKLQNTFIHHQDHNIRVGYNCMLQIYDAPKHWYTDFTRVAYVTSAHPQRVLVSYAGDASVAASIPHGNAKQCNREYICTQLHVLADIFDPQLALRATYIRRWC